MTALPECLQAATTTGLIGWLNANAGAVTGVATLALAILTGVYVVLTKRMANAAVDQARAALEQTRLLAVAQDAVLRERQRVLSRLVRHLIGEVEQLTYPLMEPQLMPRHVPWTEVELDDLRALAAAVEGTDEREVSRAVRCLRDMANLGALVYARGSSALSKIERLSWNENWQTARTALRTLAGEPR